MSPNADAIKKPDANLTSEMYGLLAEMRLLASAASSLRELQLRIVQAIADNFPYYNWTGFYMLDPAEPKSLLLGPFLGDATPHVRIPLTEGICGAAAASGESAIVVPIYAHGKVIGEIDVDSHSAAAFTGLDRAFLEATARIVGQYIERTASPAD